MSGFAGRRCLVTGGLGFIGSNLVRRLRLLEAEVTVVDALIEGHGGDRGNVEDPQVKVLVARVADRAAVRSAVEAADYVFDLAGQGSHLASARDPERDFELNATERLRFLETLRDCNPRVRAIFTSTRQVYGRPATLPVTESHAPRPADINGIAKLAAEHLYLLHHAQFGLQAVVLRLTNVYGPRQHLLSDDLGVLPVFLRRALRGEPLVVFGDGSHQRDALHVDDAVDAILAAAVSEEAVGEVINVGHGDRLSLMEMARVVAELAPGDVEIQRRPWPREHEAVAVGSIYTCSRRAEELLGWRPKRGFREGIADTLAWFAAHPERYR